MDKYALVGGLLRVLLNQRVIYQTGVSFSLVKDEGRHRGRKIFDRRKLLQLLDLRHLRLI